MTSSPNNKRARRLAFGIIVLFVPLGAHLIPHEHVEVITIYIGLVFSMAWIFLPDQETPPEHRLKKIRQKLDDLLQHKSFTYILPIFFILQLALCAVFYLPKVSNFTIGLFLPSILTQTADAEIALTNNYSTAVASAYHGTIAAETLAADVSQMHTASATNQFIAITTPSRTPDIVTLQNTPTSVESVQNRQEVTVQRGAESIAICVTSGIDPSSLIVSFEGVAAYPLIDSFDPIIDVTNSTCWCLQLEGSLLTKPLECKTENTNVQPRHADWRNLDVTISLDGMDIAFCEAKTVASHIVYGCRASLELE